MLAPFPSVVIYGLLDASSCFENCLCFVCFEIVLKSLSAAIHFVITLVSVLKSVDKENVFESVLKYFCVGAKSCFEQASKNLSTYTRKGRSFLPILYTVLSSY